MSPEIAFKKAKRRVKRDLTIVSILPLQEDWKQLKVIRKFDPKEYLLTIEKPFLLLFAENDRLVNPGWSREHLSVLYSDGLPENFSHHVALGENHRFKTSPLCYKGAWGNLKFSDNTRDVMIAWLKNEITENQKQYLSRFFTDQFWEIEQFDSLSELFIFRMCKECRLFV